MKATASPQKSSPRKAPAASTSAKKSPTQTPAAKKAAGTGAATKARAAKKPTAKKPTAKKPAAKKPATKSATAKKAGSAGSSGRKPAIKKSTAPPRTAADRAVPKVSALRGSSLADYIAGVAGWQAAAVQALCDLVQRHAPEATVAIKWSQPVFEHNGPLIWVKPASKHVTIGFWRGTEINAPAGLLEGDGDRMRHIKITSVTDVRHDVLGPLVRSAVALNRSKGDPTRRRP